MGREKNKRNILFYFAAHVTCGAAAVSWLFYYALGRRAFRKINNK